MVAGNSGIQRPIGAPHSVVAATRKCRRDRVRPCRGWETAWAEEPPPADPLGIGVGEVASTATACVCA